MIKTNAMTTTSTPETPSIGTVARKRRRQIIQQSRNNKANSGNVSSNVNDNNDDSLPPCKKICVEPITQSNRTVSDATTPVTTTATNTANTVSPPAPATNATKPKKTQMRYDPDVPMSKEEAAAWRKEQRRKRNRESAAASRQRQRDRITELETEVSEWKAKYEEALKRIERLEHLQENAIARAGMSTPAPTTLRADAIPSTHVDSDCDYHFLDSAAVSPCPSPQIRSMSSSSSQVSASPGDVVSLEEQSYCDETGRPVVCQGMEGADYHVTHLSEKISRPAVKITGATHDKLIPSNPAADDGALPDCCTSSPLSSKATTFFSCDIEPAPLSPVSQDEGVEFLANELEFDEFLLDAAEWL